MPLGIQLGLSPGDFMLDGDPVPLPSFRPISIAAKRLDASRCHLVWRYAHPRGLCVRWRASPFPQEGGGAPQFSAHAHCGQTAGWIKMSLGTEVGLGQADIVLDRDPAPLQKKAAEPPPHSPPQQKIGPRLLWPNGLMDQDGS